MATATTNPRDFTNEANQFVNKAKETAADAMDKVKQTAASFGETAGKRATEVTNAVGDGMKNLGGKIRENMPQEGYLGQASKTVADTLEDGGKYLAKEGLSGLADDVGGAIKRNPLPAVLVGIGLGFLIGRTLEEVTMATTVQNPSDASMVSLVSGIVDDVHELITQQIKLTRAEIQSDMRKAGGIAFTFAIGAGLLLLGAILACLMLVYLLHWLTSPAGADVASVPLWACFGIVGAAFGVLGGFMIAAGQKKLEATTLVPEQAAIAFKENVECLMNKN